MRCLITPTQFSEAKSQIGVIAEGYDPTIGLMHEARQGSPAFVFDLMEPYRPCIDTEVLTFLREHTFYASDFVIRSDGVCRLNPELARCLAAMVLQVRNVGAFAVLNVRTGG